jgi:hypothetical protein
MHAETDAPTDTPLITVLHHFDADGFSGQFQAVEGPAVRCLTCHTDSPISNIEANRIVRLEGASDPADMLAVIPVICPACGARGTLVSNFGPEATVEEAELLTALDRTPTPSDAAQPHPPA